jgi:hypothetical protein
MFKVFWKMMIHAEGSNQQQQHVWSTFLVWPGVRCWTKHVFFGTAWCHENLWQPMRISRIVCHCHLTSRVYIHFKTGKNHRVPQFHSLGRALCDMLASGLCGAEEYAGACDHKAGQWRPAGGSFDHHDAGRPWKKQVSWCWEIHQNRSKWVYYNGKSSN